MATPVPSTGPGTPLQLNPEETAKSLRVSLADLSAKAGALYAHKQYEEAAEVYAQAAEMQAEMNGEMNPENAELLFLYGRTLFKIGQSKSDVLGGKAPDAKKQTKPKPAKQAAAANGSNPAVAEKKNGTVETAGSSAAAIAEAEAKLDKVVGETAAKEAAEQEKEKEKSSAEPPKKPLFQFEGDDNLVDSDEEEEDDEEGEGGDEEEDDDLAVAFEILDLARVLLEKKLEAAQAQDEAQQGKGKEVAEGDSALLRHVKERLADTHDLLAEISLENERYPNAITDSRASLRYKQDLYPFESEIIAEAHFKLSLALEFASVTKPSDEDNDGNHAGEGEGEGEGEVMDQSLRDEAASELEAAIESTKRKLQSREVELATLHNPEDNEATRLQIADVKEVLADMEQRLAELRKGPIDIKSALGIPPAQPATAASSTTQPPEETKKNATDLTGLVRKKRKAEDKPAGDQLEAKKARESDGDEN